MFKTKVKWYKFIFLAFINKDSEFPHLNSKLVLSMQLNIIKVC